MGNNAEQRRNEVFYRTLEEAIGQLPVEVETLETVLSGGAKCRFRVTIGYTDSLD